MKDSKCDYRIMGKRIQQARKANRYTQEKLSEIINMSSKNLSQLERGMTGISVPTLVSLCDTLNVSSDYILFGEVNSHQNNSVSMQLSQLPQEKQLLAEKLLEVFVQACKE